ncbi:MAG: endonuclease MutS2 [Ruminococcus sp.]|nr:endonuclease MutS2 [Ruminococcus sp.]
MNNYCEVLELHKVLALLEKECANNKTKELALKLEPCTDLFTVKREVDKTSSALELSIKYGTPFFIDINDITSSIKRAESGGVLSLKELIEIKRVLLQVRELKNWREDFNGETPIDYLFECLFPNQVLENKLERAIIDENELADDASAELSSIRRKISHSGVKIRDILDKMVKSSSTQKYLQESVVTMRDGRYVLPVKTEYKGNVQGLIHDTSATGATLFIEPMAVVEANNDIRILKGKELDEIHRIIAELSAECGNMKDQILSSYDAVIKLNLYFAKANLAAHMKASKPEINNENIIVLNKARHPLIDPKKVVPINFSIGNEYNTLIITGPNTGGKTVTLKTVGLFTLMTMCGLLIPASDGCQIAIYNNILVDIGDQQSIEQNLSTFSSHINKVIEILEKADNHSLVLLDELGSGTDPIEGAALALSIIEKLKSIGVTLVTTTHYQELKMYAIDTDDVQNASCEFNVETLLPTYKLIIGTPGKSNAFAISKKLGISDDIINHAESLISSENKRFENIIDSLEQSRFKLNENNKIAEKLRYENEQLRIEITKEREKLEREKEFELEKARREAAEILKRVTRESQILIDELDSIRKQKEKDNFAQMTVNAKHKQKNTLNKIYQETNFESESNDNYVLPRPLKKGDKVLITDTNRNGIVISPPDNKGICFVQIGIMKTKVDISKIRLVEKTKNERTNNKKEKSNSISTKGIESRMTRKIQSELDIRGYASDDGIYEVDSFLDDAVMSGLTLVTIIHGKGTGVLKNAVRNHLKHHPHVKSSRKGVYGEGEDGVTVVELK